MFILVVFSTSKMMPTRFCKWFKKICSQDSDYCASTIRKKTLHFSETEPGCGNHIFFLKLIYKIQISHKAKLDAHENQEDNDYSIYTLTKEQNVNYFHS